MEPLYGLDIETDTAVDGLDPRVAPIVAAAVTGDIDDPVTVLMGDEGDILTGLDAVIAGLEPGVIVTWNGGRFDLPFLADRAALHQLRLGLHLQWDPNAIRPGRAPLPGHTGGYTAEWHGHRHLDAYRAWRQCVVRDPEISCSLKAVARAEGLHPVEVDIGSLHLLDDDELEAYVVSDAQLTADLARLRWTLLRRFLDVPPPAQQSFAYPA